MSFRIETPKVCLNCKRLNLKCSYNKVYQFGAECLKNGLAFGRSNQHKKQKLKSEFEETLNHINDQELDFETFKKSNVRSLSNIVQSAEIPWVKPATRKLYFINATKDDFTESNEFNGTRNLLLNFHSNFLSHPLATLIQNSFSNNSNTSLVKQTSFENLITNYFNENEMFDLFTTSNDPLFGGIPEPNMINYFDLNMGLNIDLNLFDPLSLLSNQEKQLFQYFVNTICPNCICYPHEDSSSNININININSNNTNKVINPYLYLIVPLALRSEVVMNAVIATSAHQLFLLGGEEYEKISQKYTDLSLNQLAELLKRQNTIGFDWDEVLATVLMMCFKEISSTCDYRSSWMIYLNCAKQFINKFTSQSKLSPLCNFFARYFIVHEIMGETAWLQRKQIDSNSFQGNFNISEINLDIVYDNSDTEQFMNHIFNPIFTTNSEEKDTTIDVVFGCCPYLISLIHKISNLGRTYEDLENEPAQLRREFEEYIVEERDSIKKELENLEQRVVLSEALDTNSEACILVIAEIKRLSTLIYLYARVDLEAIYYKYHNVKYFQSKEILPIKEKIMELYRKLPKCPMSLIWPLFVFGLVCADTEYERWFVLDKLMYLQSSRELGSVKTAKNVILAVWKERDLELSNFRWKSMLKGRTESLSLA